MALRGLHKLYVVLVVLPRAFRRRGLPGVDGARHPPGCACCCCARLAPRVASTRLVHQQRRATRPQPPFPCVRRTLIAVVDAVPHRLEDGRPHCSQCELAEGAQFCVPLAHQHSHLVRPCAACHARSSGQRHTRAAQVQCAAIPPVPRSRARAPHCAPGPRPPRWPGGVVEWAQKRAQTPGERCLRNNRCTSEIGLYICYYIGPPSVQDDLSHYTLSEGLGFRV